MRDVQPDEARLYAKAMRGLVASRLAIQDVVAQCGSGSVVLLDLDGFTRVNERFGCGLGDRLLGRIEHALQLAVRGHGHVVAIGGDQFLVVLPDVVPEWLSLSSLLSAVRHTSVRSRLGRSVRVTASAGAARCPGNEDEVGDSLRAAQSQLTAARGGSHPQPGSSVDVRWAFGAS